MIDPFASKAASCFRPNLPLCYRHVPSFALISMQEHGEEVNLVNLNVAFVYFGCICEGLGRVRGVFVDLRKP